MRINLGSGTDRRSGYINIDAFTPEADVRSDLCGLGLRADAIDEVYCSHVLEHLAEPQVLTALGEMRRVLKIDEGRVVILVPDFTWCLENWMNLPESQRWGWAIDTIFGNQNHEGEYHRTGFTHDRIRDLLRKTGFEAIETGSVFTHGMQSIKAVAKPGRLRRRIEIPKRAVNKVVMAKYRLKGFRDSRSASGVA
jgi:predicted SAM-dependent methyltransferase